MSRTFSKVLVICAMVVVLPLMIVGTAFAAFYSIDDVVNVATVFVNDLKSPSEDVYARIIYGDTRAESHKITEGHTKSVDVTADFSSVAYTFEGWYSGTKETYTNGTAELITKDKLLNIKMNGSADYIAVYSAVKYNVSFSYTTNPSDPSTLKDEEAKEYIYGQALPDLTNSYTGIDYSYAGWKIDGANTDNRYTAVTFEDRDVKLVSPWKESNVVTATFHNGDKKVSKELYISQSWDIPEISDEFFVDLGIETKAGYAYSWQSNNAGYVTISPIEDMDLYLVESVVDYKVNLTLSDASFLKTGVSVDELTINVTDKFNAFNTWFGYETKYSFWNITGIKYGEQTYTAEQLQELAVAYATDKSNTFDLVVNKNFTSIKAEGGIQYLSSLTDVSKVYDQPIYDGASLNDLDRVTETGTVTCDTAKTLQEFILGGFITADGREPLYVGIKEDNKIVAWIVELKELVFTINGNVISITVSEEDVLVDLIEKVLAQYKANYGELAGAEELVITDLEVRFYPSERAGSLDTPTTPENPDPVDPTPEIPENPGESEDGDESGEVAA